MRALAETIAIAAPDYSILSCRSFASIAPRSGGAEGKLQFLRVCSVRYVPKLNAGIYCRYISPVLPVPDTSVVLYDINTGTTRCVKFGTIWIPVLDTWVNTS